MNWKKPNQTYKLSGQISKWLTQSHRQTYFHQSICSHQEQHCKGGETSAGKNYTLQLKGLTTMPLVLNLLPLSGILGKLVINSITGKHSTLVDVQFKPCGERRTLPATIKLPFGESVTECKDIIWLLVRNINSVNNGVWHHENLKRYNFNWRCGQNCGLVQCDHTQQWLNITLHSHASSLPHYQIFNSLTAAKPWFSAVIHFLKYSAFIYCTDELLVDHSI